MSVQPVGGSSVTQASAQPSKDYVVQHGDTMSSIAKSHGVSESDLAKANPQVLNPDVIYPGQHLTIPDPPKPAAAASSGGVKVDGGLNPSQYREAKDKLNDKLNGTSPAPTPAGTTTKTKNEPKVTIGSDGVGASNKTTQSTTTTHADGSSNKTSASATYGGSYDPNKGTVTISTGAGFGKEIKNAHGYGVSFGVDGNVSVTGGQKTKDGVTTYTASADASVTVSGGISAPKAGVSGSVTKGIKTSFEVKMPEAAAKTANLAKVNPFDPTTMPTGTVVKLDGSTYTGTDFKVTFKELAVQTKTTDEKGTSLLVEKTGDSKVRVTAGPTEALSAYNGVGVDLGVASAMLGRNDKLSSATLKTAEFDLSTPQGKAAYNDFLATGTFPSANGKGVDGVATIEKLDYSSQSKLDAKIGPIGISLDGAKNTGNSVVTTTPDGSITRTVNLQYSGNVPMTISQKFDPSGKEIVGERRYSYTIKTDANSAQLLNVAQTGSVANATSGPVKAGQTVTLTYTESQMRDLMGKTQAAVKAMPIGGNDLKVLTQDYDGKFVDSPWDFALGLGRNLGGSDYGSAQRLFNISSAADGDLRKGYVALPGTISTQ